MSSPKTHAEKTSAADKSIGFDYQYYYFLLKALNLKVGQSVGLEVKDDVHTELNQSSNIFYQLKHTTQLAADGMPIALTKLDKDMWKTLYNWAMFITDVAAGRGGTKEQLAFTRKSEFHLVANKKMTESNSVYEAIDGLQLHTLTLSQAKAKIEEALQATSDANIQKYITTVIALESAVLENFLLQIRFELEVVDILKSVHQAILELHVDKEKIDVVFAGIDSSLRTHAFNAVKAGKPVILSFEEFHNKVRKHIQDGRSTKLTLKEFKPALPSDLFMQTFIKRLMEVGVVEPNDVEWAVELTVLKLQLALHIEHWEQAGEVTPQDIAALHDAVMISWKSKFRLRYVGSAGKDIEEIGRQILSEMLASAFSLNDDVLSLPHCHGEIYYLSDLGNIGWHKDWATK